MNNFNVELSHDLNQGLVHLKQRKVTPNAKVTAAAKL
jgi:hypothetical protein